MILFPRVSFIDLPLLLIFLISSCNLLGQEQIGNDFYGPGSSYFNGRSVSTSGDGSRIVIGASRVFSNATFNGQVAVYDRSGNDWLAVGNPIEGGATDRLGTSVAISSDGTTIVTGGTSNSQFGTNAGVARAFRWSGTSWDQIGQDLFGTYTGGYYGSAVAISENGTMIAVSAPRHYDSSSRLGGLIEIYRLNSSNQWELVGDPLRGININGDERAGSDLSLSADGSRVAIAHPFYRLNGFDRGAVRVFDLIGNSWQQVGTTFIGDDDSDHTGSAVSLSADGNTIAVGDKADEAFGQNNGTVKIYQWSGAAWSQVGSTLTEFGNPGISVGNFGFELDLSDDANRLVVTAPFGEASNGQQLGFLQLYEFANGDWEKIGTQVESNQTFSDFGYTVGISGDGLTVIVGASSDDSFLTNAGLARVYDYSNVLPVELLSFDAVPRKDKVDLKWSTTNEEGNAGFNVQFSTNGIEWQTLDFVSGVGETTLQNDYAFTHFNPAYGSNFYRLEQVDLDGQTSLSHVIYIEISHTDKWISIYPNPVTSGVINLILPDSDENYQFVILDYSGREIQRGILTRGHALLNLTGVKRGSYILQVSTNTELHHQKLCISNSF